ncbi:elongation of very long chain fatty acids protein, putative [Pediculus humanus corporis]|uniref:Elongation of very long chain fatty acids protein n=1 Tax=Pediculus humanus subsp. corporis TaxID=121224 RepID=E0W1G7_PEDHC|nr:elongation of very long chain fatty acids protein, putative [Pediculus humanus corporis]EEB19473.1 elongation of very long chain fatty acids protein, putative [Pediculus humanus corporis]
MAYLMHRIIDNYIDLMENKSGIKLVFFFFLNPRVKNWPLMSSPLPTFIICVSFVYIVKVIGPKLMENRKPFELKNVLIIYNFIQVIFSTWLFYECIQSGWFTFYSFRCQPVDYSTSPIAMRMASGCWWYFISKFTEFLDTIFFVLRKKNDHISTLHVTHHAVMPMSVWFGVKFTPGGHSTFFGLLNTFVHIIMYSYYMFSAMGPQYQKYLWWKKYLTALQMIQFVLVMIHAFQLLFIECNYPQAFVWWIGLHAIMFYFLFADFYKQAYLKKERAKKIANEKKKSEDEKDVKTNGVVHSSRKNVEENGGGGGSKKTGNKVFFNGFANICQMDHALLYEDDDGDSNNERRTKEEHLKRN